MIYSYIRDHKDEYSVVKMCQVLEVSKSGFYKWACQQAQDDRTERTAWREELKRMIAKSYHESLGTYGSPRILEDLKEWGYSVCERTVGRLMKEMGLRAVPEVKFTTTTDSNHNQFIYPNLLERKFLVDAPNKVWVADITYIWTMEGWLYLASVMDLFSRKIVGWSLEATMVTELPLQALEKALLLRNPEGELFHHSDRGSQYCSTDYIDRLKWNNFQISMSRKGDPYDNACIESFHATLKKELVYRRRFRTRKEAREAISHYIDDFYNTRRRHSTLGYLSPETYEKKAGFQLSERTVS
ncbi:IS3 family transposase [Sporosarcina cyprini]|uniref:IS3 family transposase n=1 Tax=Sporosarcina cyprini TaxID=2910523 RepID=UPI001EDF217B|nr:IS3 family transposase [Sporosarcina cyprini]MCG3089897.1 IS3 family transposase [Sporosarcina cyprini]MCG3089913.1 IS3 family transposase [Sporosarcina cyprini]